MENIWTSEERNKMIDRSDNYGTEKIIYQFGYYDGYCRAFDKFKEENKRLRFMVENGLGYEDMKNDI